MDEIEKLYAEHEDTGGERWNKYKAENAFEDSYAQSPVVYFPLSLPTRGGAMAPGTDIPVEPEIRLIFHRRNKAIFSCMSCAEAGLEWFGTESMLAHHANNHQDMLQWAWGILANSRNPADRAIRALLGCTLTRGEANEIIKYVNECVPPTQPGKRRS
jgi:hypothetical protein